MKRSLGFGCVFSLVVSGCSAVHHSMAPTSQPSIAATSQPTDIDPIRLSGSEIRPMYRELLAIDLDTTLRTATAENFDIRSARQQVEAACGRFQSIVGGAFPVLVPSAVFERVEGTVRAVRGDLVGAGFNTFQPGIAAQWVLNPGQVIYQIIAAQKHFYAVEHLEESVVQESLRLAATQYYDLALAQSRVSTAAQAVEEADELVRINKLRAKTGMGVSADEMRAEARLSERQQDLVIAMNGFYKASVDLALTLHLDSAVTLIPKAEQIPARILVRADISLDELVELAVVHRPDLQNVKSLVAEAVASLGATWWGAFGPQFQVSYQYSGITGHAEDVVPGQGIPNNLIVNPASANGSFNSNPVVNGAIREGISRFSTAAAGTQDQTFGFSDQQRMGATAGWRFSLSAIGDLRTSGALKEQAVIEVQRRLDQVKAQVILANQASRTYWELMIMSMRQVAAANETLRLSQANLQAGTMTTLDVLQAQDAANQARLRHAESVIRYNQSQINLVTFLGLSIRDRS